MIRVLTAALLATAAYAGPASAQSGGTVDLAYVESVSYTHLTLPTKRIV